MALAFTTDTVQPKIEAIDILEILNAQEELNTAWMNLTDARKNMEEVCEVMENIRVSTDLITKYGMAGVEQLNIDGSLEALCGVEAKLLTAEKAMEGLKCAELTAMEGFVDTIKAFIQKIIEFCKRFILKIKNLRSLSDNSEELIRSITDEQIRSVMITSPSHVETKTPRIVYNEGWLFYKVGSESLYGLEEEETFKSCMGALSRVERVQNILWESLSNFSDVIEEQSEELDDIVSNINDIVPTSILGGIRSRSDLQEIYDRSRELSDFGVNLITDAKSVMEDSRLKNAINSGNESLRSIISLYARTVEIVTPIVGRTERTSKICGDFAREIDKQSKQELK